MYAKKMISTCSMDTLVGITIRVKIVIKNDVACAALTITVL